MTAMRNPMTGADGAVVEVLPGRLWQSGRPVGLDAILTLCINAIVSVGDAPQSWLRDWRESGWRVEPGKPQRPVSLHAPLIDASGFLDPVGADVAIAAVVGLLRDPRRKVLVHCDMGAFRSVHVSASALAEIEGCDSATACKRVDTARGNGPYRDSALSCPDWKEHAESYPRNRTPTDSASTHPNPTPEHRESE